MYLDDFEEIKRINNGKKPQKIHYLKNVLIM
jgi:hypothetical protein